VTLDVLPLRSFMVFDGIEFIYFKGLTEQNVGAYSFNLILTDERGMQKIEEVIVNITNTKFAGVEDIKNETDDANEIKSVSNKVLITAKIMNTSITGQVFIQFNNDMQTIEAINSSLLEVKVLPSADDVNATQLNLTWEVVQQKND
jgi:translation elongation factor EF-1beta